MLIRRIARPMLSATFIARSVETLRDPSTSTESTRRTLGALSALPGPVGAGVPNNADTVARVNAAVQVGGGLLLALGRAPRLTAAALAITMIPEAFVDGKEVIEHPVRPVDSGFYKPEYIEKDAPTDPESRDGI